MSRLRNGVGMWGKAAAAAGLAAAGIVGYVAGGTSEVTVTVEPAAEPVEAAELEPFEVDPWGDGLTADPYTGGEDETVEQVAEMVEPEPVETSQPTDEPAEVVADQPATGDTTVDEPEDTVAKPEKITGRGSVEPWEKEPGDNKPPPPPPPTPDPDPTTPPPNDDPFRESNDGDLVD